MEPKLIKLYNNMYITQNFDTIATVRFHFAITNYSTVANVQVIYIVSV